MNNLPVFLVTSCPLPLALQTSGECNRYDCLLCTASLFQKIIKILKHFEHKKRKHFVNFIVNIVVNEEGRGELSVLDFGARFRNPVRFPALPVCLRSTGSGTVSTQPREYNWGATWKKKYSGLGNRDYGRKGSFTLITLHHAIRKSWH
jgi:hypothetical protein